MCEIWCFGRNKWNRLPHEIYTSHTHTQHRMSARISIMWIIQYMVLERTQPKTRRSQVPPKTKNADNWLNGIIFIIIIVIFVELEHGSWFARGHAPSFDRIAFTRAFCALWVALCIEPLAIGLFVIYTELLFASYDLCDQMNANPYVYTVYLPCVAIYHSIKFILGHTCVPSIGKSGVIGEIEFNANIPIHTSSAFSVYSYIPSFRPLVPNFPKHLKYRSNGTKRISISRFQLNLETQSCDALCISLSNVNVGYGGQGIPFLIPLQYIHFNYFRNESSTENDYLSIACVRVPTPCIKMIAQFKSHHRFRNGLQYLIASVSYGR